MKTNRTHDRRRTLLRHNLDLFRRLNKDLPGGIAIDQLRQMTKTLGLSLALGDCLYLNGGWYVTHSGLLRLALRRRCAGIRVQQIREFCDPAVGRWVFRATLYKRTGSYGFVGYGDADPSNVSPLVHGAEMRVAETRAVNRALRKAYGIGLCSVEELGWEPKMDRPADPQRSSSTVANNGQHNSQPRLRDRLCLVIRQHQLDANLVKAYAADSCGTPNLRDATREQIESFITNLSDWATKDRAALLCKLNSYATPPEVSL
jgi:hypothetical protein